MVVGRQSAHLTFGCATMKLEIVDVLTGSTPLSTPFLPPNAETPVLTPAKAKSAKQA